MTAEPFTTRLKRFLSILCDFNFTNFLIFAVGSDLLSSLFSGLPWINVTFENVVESYSSRTCSSSLIHIRFIFHVLMFLELPFLNFMGHIFGILYSLYISYHNCMSLPRHSP